jgi:hypothetical protein
MRPMCTLPTALTALPPLAGASGQRGCPQRSCQHCLPQVHPAIGQCIQPGRCPSTAASTACLGCIALASGLPWHCHWPVHPANEAAPVQLPALRVSSTPCHWPVHPANRAALCAAMSTAYFSHNAPLAAASGQEGGPQHNCQHCLPQVHPAIGRMPHAAANTASLKCTLTFIREAAQRRCQRWQPPAHPSIHRRGGLLRSC